jgi:hypothetical protein
MTGTVRFTEPPLIIEWHGGQNRGLSLENSGFSQLCRKALEWLSDDTTIFIICCEPGFRSHWCKKD